MARNRKRKTNRGMVPKDVMKLAAQEVIELRRGKRATAAKYGICHVTLGRFCKKVSQGISSPQIGYRPHTKVFTDEEEKELAEYLKRSADIYFGLPPSEVRKLAYEYATVNNKKMPPSWEKKKSAGPDWFTAFLKRNQSLSIRTPEATSLHRAMNFNRMNVGKFYDKLMEVIEKHSLPPHRIWNTDETGVTTVHKPNKIVSQKGKKQIGAVTSAERGQLVTVCTAVSATGNSIPPIFIFPRAKFHDHFIRDGPLGSIGRANKSGWMQSKEFFDFIKHFAEHTKPSVNDKVLLLLDNHDSHIYIPTIDFCRKNGIILLSFPPHTSHRLQPLDRGVYGPFKKYVATQMETWMLNNPGKTMSIYDIPGIVKVALPLATTINNICNGFSCTGIVPYNRNIFTDSDYAPAEVTEHHLSTSVRASDERTLTEIVESLDIREGVTEYRPSSSQNHLTREDRSSFSVDAALLTPRQEQPLETIFESSSPIISRTEVSIRSRSRARRNATEKQCAKSIVGLERDDSHPKENSIELTKTCADWNYAFDPSPSFVQDLVILEPTDPSPTVAFDIESGMNTAFVANPTEKRDCQNVSREQSTGSSLSNLQVLGHENVGDLSEMSIGAFLTVEELTETCTRWNNALEQSTGSSSQNLTILELDPSPVVTSEVETRGKKDIAPPNFVKPTTIRNRRKVTRKKSTGSSLQNRVIQENLRSKNVSELCSGEVPTLEEPTEIFTRLNDDFNPSTSSSLQDLVIPARERPPSRRVSEPSTSSNSLSFTTPAKIRPYPQASAAITQRKGGRVKLHSAILTDSPERRSIINRKKGAEKRKSQLVANESRAKKAKKQVPKGRKKKEPESFCLVCNEPYSTSKVSWVQCIGCKMWAHETCTAGNLDYYCQGCDRVVD